MKFVFVSRTVSGEERGSTTLEIPASTFMVGVIVIALAVLPGCLLVTRLITLSPTSVITNVSKRMGVKAGEKVAVESVQIEAGVLQQAIARCVPVSGNYGNGTGIYMGDGKVLTALHVIADDLLDQEDTLKVAGNSATFLHRTKRVNDLSLLLATKEVQATRPILQESGLKEGDPVFSVGNPDGTGTRVITGYISAPLDSDNNVVITMNVPSGFSGSALYNLRGQLVGLVTSVSNDEDGVFTYARPASEIKKFMASK